MRFFNGEAAGWINGRANVHVTGCVVEFRKESILENIYFVDVELIPKTRSVVGNVADFYDVVGRKFPLNTR